MLTRLSFSWADAAICWLAQSKDLEAEQEAMGTAMQASLSEAEAHKASQVSHQQLDDQNLKLRYNNSRILQQVTGACSSLLTQARFQGIHYVMVCRYVNKLAHVHPGPALPYIKHINLSSLLLCR